MYKNHTVTFIWKWSILPFACCEWVKTQQFENHRPTRFLIKRQTHIKTRKYMKISFNIAAVPTSMDIKLAVFRPAPASTHRFLLALDSGKHLPSHISSTEEKRARFPTPSLLSYAFHQPPMFPTLETNKKDERERERGREWRVGGAGDTADAVITLDICNTFFCWSEAAIFPETRWWHYNTKVEWLHLTDREVREWVWRQDTTTVNYFLHSFLCILISVFLFETKKKVIFLVI